MPSLLQAALAEQDLANQKLQTAFTTPARHCESCLQLLLGKCQALLPLLLLQSWMLTCSCALQAQLESERKASQAALANEQEGRRLVQVN